MASVLYVLERADFERIKTGLGPSISNYVVSVMAERLANGVIGVLQR